MFGVVSSQPSSNQLGMSWLDVWNVKHLRFPFKNVEKLSPTEQHLGGGFSLGNALSSFAQGFWGQGLPGMVGCWMMLLDWDIEDY